MAPDRTSDATILRVITVVNCAAVATPPLAAKISSTLTFTIVAAGVSERKVPITTCG